AGAATADLDGDGKLDLAVIDNGGKGQVCVMLGRGDGTFGTQTCYLTLAKLSYVKTGDLNGDGRPDLVVSGLAGIGSLLNMGNGAFGSMVANANAWERVALVDANSDG